MKLPSNVTAILDRPMGRKEFLKHIGMAGLFVVGAGFIAKALGGAFQQSQLNNPTDNNLASAYGRSTYGR